MKWYDILLSKYYKVTHTFLNSNFKPNVDRNYSSAESEESDEESEESDEESEEYDEEPEESVEVNTFGLR